MKKFCFILVLSFLSFRTYGIHNLLINGSSTLTVTTVDTLHITASFDGDSFAKATVYYDINGNGQLDLDDTWIFKSKLIDGGFDDEDEIVNGQYHEIYDSLTFQGKFLFYAEDNGVSDTISITVNPTTSSHSISGKVTTPINQPHILVSTIRIINRDNGKFEYGYGDFTDTNGNYSISIPEKYANKYWNIIALDIAEVVPFYSSNDVLNDSIYISGTVTKNIEMCFAPTDTITELTGKLRDDLGSLITAPVQVMGVGSIDGFNHHARPGKTDVTGTYSISIKKATSGICYIYVAQASIAGQLYPDFMNPVHQQRMNFLPAPNTITMDFKAYRTTNFISGYVYKDGAPYDKCHLDCSASGYGGTYTKTFSDGSYLMPVSDSPSSYTIIIAKKSIPEGYTVYNELDLILPNALQSSILPGATSINFFLKAHAIEELSKPQLVTTLFVHPNPFMNEVVFELSDSERIGNLVLYDIAGKQITEIKPETQNGLTHFVLSSGNKKLSTGIYFYSLKTGSKIFKGKVIKLR